MCDTAATSPSGMTARRAVRLSRRPVLRQSVLRPGFSLRPPGGAFMQVTTPRKMALLSLAVAVFACAVAPRAEAAGTAYGTDTADVGEVGNCKIESWFSWASNQNFLAVSNPSCIVDLSRPVEISAQIQRARSDDEWGALVAPKFKTNLVPTAIGRFGFALAGGAMLDPVSRENTGLWADVPATLRLSNVARINLNAGWLWDRVADQHYLTYAAGIDYRTPDNVWTLTAEIFGQAGIAETASVTQPRLQLGLR